MTEEYLDNEEPEGRHAELPPPGETPEPGEVSAGEAWSVGRVVKASHTFMRGLGLPRMVRPSALGEQYDFPTDLKVLTSSQLGQLQLQLTAYYTYSIGVLGEEEGTNGAFQEVFDIKLGLAMQEEADRHARRTPVKEILRAIAISQNPDLNKLHKSLIARRHRTKLLEIQSTIYHEQLVRLSREQSRRESESRYTG
jgi:hypothetical protein